MIIFYTQFNNEKEKYITHFLIISIVLTVCDLIWLLICSPVRRLLIKSITNNQLDGNAEKGIRGIVFSTSLISMIAKLVLSLSIWIIKLKISRGENEPLNQI